MGSTLSCLAQRQSKDFNNSYGDTATLSPAHSLRKRCSGSLDQQNGERGPTLQDCCLQTIARSLSCGRLATKQLSVLPIDLLQRVIDEMVEQDALTLPLLQGLVTPWLHHLHLGGLSAVDDTWLPVLAGVRHCCSLSLSGAALSDAGVSWLPWLWNLQELRLQHCSGISDTGLADVCELVRLRVLDVEGCEGLTPSCLQHIGASLTALTQLNMSQCAGLKGHTLNHLAGLQQLQHLSLGWCRGLGAAAADPTNTITPLACLTRLTHLNLGGTQVCDAQLRVVLPHLTALQELDVSRSGVTAAGLCGLTSLAGSLRVLLMRGGAVSDGVGAAALASLTSLHTLDLSCSSISSSGLLCLGPLGVQLTALNLDMCHVGDEACRVFRSLTKLECLDLSDTAVGDEGVSYLKACRRLKQLSLCNTDCSNSSAVSLAALTHLTHLNLDARDITDACLPLLLPLGGGLRELDVSGGRITTRGVALLAVGFRGLQVLDLCGGHITDRSCPELAKLSNLRRLNLSQNRALSDGGIRILAAPAAPAPAAPAATAEGGATAGGAPAAAAGGGGVGGVARRGGLGGSLESLNLSYTSVTDESVTSLISMKALQVVVLSYSCVSEAGAQRLRQARPRLSVKAAQHRARTASNGSSSSSSGGGGGGGGVLF